MTETQQASAETPTGAQKVALVTGANKGIGFVIARRLGQAGVTVLLGVRDAARGEAASVTLRAEGIDAVAIPLDVTNQESIDAAATEIGRRWSRLDILVNNAGISLHERQTPPSELTVSALRQTYDTNVFGLFAVTRAMLPLLRRSEAGRIVNLSSPMGSLTLRSDQGSIYANLPPTLGYGSSKTAVNAITVFLAAELRQTPIKINAVSPGYVATDLNEHSGYLTPEQGAELPVKFALLPADGPSGGFFEGETQIPW